MFYDCKNLKSFVVPNSASFICEYAFEGCTGLTSITISESVTSIREGAFSGCTGLTSITIPNSVTSIGKNAFDYCSGLTSVHISDLAAWCNISFGSSPLEKAHHLYLNGEEITDLVIPSSVTSIGRYAFRDCTGLTSVIIHNSVTSIGYSAFSGCTGLTSVTIGNSVTSIKYGAFAGCNALAEITCLAKMPPSIGSFYTFPETFNISPDAKLYVPVGSGSAYKSSEWKNYFKQDNIIEKEM